MRQVLSVCKYNALLTSACNLNDLIVKGVFFLNHAETDREREREKEREREEERGSESRERAGRERESREREREQGDRESR